MEYYFISDLHIGGDAELDICDFEEELIAFLRELEKKDRDTELIIAGDVFGFWELTGVEGTGKLETIAGNHRALFDQFQKTDVYLKAARKVFARDPSVAVYLFGHTHTPSLRHLDGRVIINTGTWLKMLTRVKARFRLLPAVYYPAFRLNYFRIFNEEGRIVIEYRLIPRAPVTGLTLLQRLVTLGRKRTVNFDIPARTVLPGM